MKQEFFIISELHRDDLVNLGFDSNSVDDDGMKELASKLGDDYCNQLFWNSLKIIAENLDIKKLK